MEKDIRDEKQNSPAGTKLIYRKVYSVNIYQVFSFFYNSTTETYTKS